MIFLLIFRECKKKKYCLTRDCSLFFYSFSSFSYIVTGARQLATSPSISGHWKDACASKNRDCPLTISSPSSKHQSLIHSRETESCAVQHVNLDACKSSTFFRTWSAHSSESPVKFFENIYPRNFLIISLQSHHMKNISNDINTFLRPLAAKKKFDYYFNSRGRRCVDYVERVGSLKFSVRSRPIKKRYQPWILSRRLFGRTSQPF